MAAAVKKEAQNPLLLRAHRLMEAFAKSDDERDFYLDRVEGFIVFVDLDKSIAEIKILEDEIKGSPTRYCLIPKLTFYETKKIMEGFVNEKVYDIDTKEKLLDIIQSKEAREHFLEFIYDHHSELEKWQQFYQERSRIRIIEWLRSNHFNFVFEEDLELPVNLLERVKEQLFEAKAGKEVLSARKTIASKAKTYYSSEALNPRPKRGRPPKQTMKLEVEQQVSKDIYLTVPLSVRPFLFIPDISTASEITFSSKFESGEELMASMRVFQGDVNFEAIPISKKLEELRTLSTGWSAKSPNASTRSKEVIEDFSAFDDDEDDDEEDFDEEFFDQEEGSPKPKKLLKKTAPPLKGKKESAPAPQKKKESSKPSAKKETKKAPPKTLPAKKLQKTASPKSKQPKEKEPSKKKALLRRTAKSKP